MMKPQIYICLTAALVFTAIASAQRDKPMPNPDFTKGEPVPEGADLS